MSDNSFCRACNVCGVKCRKHFGQIGIDRENTYAILDRYFHGIYSEYAYGAYTKAPCEVCF